MPSRTIQRSRYIGTETQYISGNWRTDELASFGTTFSYGMNLPRWVFPYQPVATLLIVPWQSWSRTDGRLFINDYLNALSEEFSVRVIWVAKQSISRETEEQMTWYYLSRDEYFLGNLLLLYWECHNKAGQGQMGDFAYRQNGAKNVAKVLKVCSNSKKYVEQFDWGPYWVLHLGYSYKMYGFETSYEWFLHDLLAWERRGNHTPSSRHMLSSVP